MSQYSSMTVVQLKEALKEKGLPADGKKADLVARLAEAAAPLEGELGGELDEEDAPAAAPADTTETPVEAPAESAQGSAENAETGTDNAEKSAPPKEEKPKPKVLTAEERKQLAVDLLTKKIKRAEKFGDEALATAAKKDLARVEKFGVDAGTALAKEIGLLNHNVNSELGERRWRKKGRKVQK